MNFKYTLVAAVLLMLSLVSSAGAADGSIYLVASESALLRSYPSSDSGILAKLKHFDQVEYLDCNAHGWWKVRSLHTDVTGWMTADLLTVSKPMPPALTKSQYMYVNTASADLKVIPLATAATTGTVRLNDKVEKLGVSSAGWTKVKNIRNDNLGWLSTRFLSSKTVTAPHIPAPKIHHYNKSKKKKQEVPKEDSEEQAKPM